MRRTLTVCRNGLSVAAAAVLLTACGGSDEGNSSSSASGETSSSASGSAASADSEFCTAAASIQERIASTLNEQSDPSSLPQTLQQAAEEVRAVEPPDEIAADWATFADGLERIAQVFGSIDPNDPNAAATLQQQLQQLQAELGQATTNVQTYLQEECGLEPDPTEPASPTS
jgi:hypothetical protein